MQIGKRDAYFPGCGSSPWERKQRWAASRINGASLVLCGRWSNLHGSTRPPRYRRARPARSLVDVASRARANRIEAVENRGARTRAKQNDRRWAARTGREKSPRTGRRSSTDCRNELHGLPEAARVELHGLPEAARVELHGLPISTAASRAAPIATRPDRSAGASGGRTVGPGVARLNRAAHQPTRAGRDRWALALGVAAREVGDGTR